MARLLTSDEAKLYCELTKVITEWYQIQLNLQFLSRANVTFGKLTIYKGKITEVFGWYVRNKITILIPAKNPNMIEAICVMAHELGHHIARTLGEVDPGQYHIPKYRVHEEVVAWDHAAKVLKALKFEAWKEFLQTRDDSLRSYLQRCVFMQEQIKRQAQLINMQMENQWQVESTLE